MITSNQVPRLLVYSRTTGYRHDSIPAGVGALRLLGGQAGCTVDATEDPAVFTPGGLSRYAAVVFLSTSGDVLDEAGRDALERYMAAGGAWLGIHGAATTQYGWPYFGGLAGARFNGHPPEQTAMVTVEDPATRRPPPARGLDLARRVVRLPRRPAASGPRAAHRGRGELRRRTMGADHPIAWCHEHGGGRCFYTALGHAARTFSEPRSSVISAAPWSG